MHQTATKTEPQRGAGLTFCLDADGRGLLATVVPDAAAQPIDEAWLRERLAELGLDCLNYLPAAATALLAKYNCGTAVTVKLAECTDGAMRIVMTPDILEAELHLEPAHGGAPVTIDAVVEALAEAGVTWGVDYQAIQAAVAGDTAQGVVVARGRAPVNGSDGYLESLLPEVRSRVPRVDESGHTDYRDLGGILNVHPGDDLILRHPPTAGTGGLSLRGEPIPAASGKEIMYSASLPGTAYAADNPNLLQAAISGQPVQVRGGMMVEPVFTVEDVNTACGNIDFDGSVVIRGDVSAGMAVRATGDIEIGGTAEMAVLAAGGSIVIKGGALGNPGQTGAGEFSIHCGGSFNAAFAQKARIDAGDSIFIDDTAMQCELTAVNHIRVGDKRRGHIIGGTARATLSITAKVLGSPNRVRTHIEIGVNPLVHKQLTCMSKERDVKENQLLEVSKLLDFSRKNPGKLPATTTDKARATAAVLSAEIAAQREEQELLEKKIELSQTARAVAQQAAYEGVEVVMGNQRYRVAGEHGAVAIQLGAGGLGLAPLQDATGI